MKKIIKRSQGLALLTVSLVTLCLGLAVIEASYRIVWALKKPVNLQDPALDAYDDPKQFFGRTPGIARMDYHTYLGYTPRPSFSAPDYHHNAQHFRYDEDVPVEKPANELRIFVTGGSTAWGVGVHQDAMYAALMEKILAEKHPGRKIRVISAGAGGYCTTQERILIENRLLDFSPDIIVMLSGWNDTYFGYRGKKILEDNDFLGYREQIEGRAPTSFHPLDPPDYARYDLKLRYILDKARYHRLYPSRDSLEVAIRAHSLPIDETVAALERNVMIANLAGKRWHFPIIYVLQPCAYATKKSPTAWETHLNEWGELNEIGFPEYLRQAYEKIRVDLPAVARKEGFQFYDSDEALLAEPRSVFFDSVHLSDRGNRLLAAYLVDRLEKEIRRK